MPLIGEERLAPLYCPENGRPNRPVEAGLGVLLLKEMLGLTDLEALEQLEFSLLWHHALALKPQEAHLCQRTLHNFRAGLMEHGLARVAFAETTDRILQVLRTQVCRQRLGSMHVVSNIAQLTCLGLFCETIRVFLCRLQSAHPRLHGHVPQRVRGRHVKEDGQPTGYEDARSSQGRRRRAVCARDVYRLCRLLGGTAAAQMEEYALLERLLQEQCEVVKRKQRPDKGDDDAGKGRVPVVLKEVGSASLQSPHDADVTHSGRKGKGYEVRVAETCDEANAVEIITHVEVTASCGSDPQATVPTLEALQARALQPQELVVDTAYGSGNNAVAAAHLGTELVSPVAGPAVGEQEESAPGAWRAQDFLVDARPEEPAECPAGHLSRAQMQSPTHANYLEVTFERLACEGCGLFAQCPAPLNEAADGYVLHVDLRTANLEHRRRAQSSGVFEERYAIRAGIEATNSELKRAHGLGDLRVRGQPRVELAVHLKALACNLKRMVRAFMSAPDRIAPEMA